MVVNTETLPDAPAELKELIVELLAAHDKETGILLEQIRHLRAQLFGRKSEKTGVVVDATPLPLFDMPEPEDDEDQAEDKIPVRSHTRKKGGRKPLPEELPRVEVVHDLDDDEKVCDCGCDLTRIGEEVSEQLDIVPAKARVIRHIRPQYACKHCEGALDNGPTVRIAPVHPQIIPKSIASPGLLAYILTGKFIDHNPFYRQEKQFLRIGIEISRATMCNWAMRVAEACQPLLNLLHDEILSGFYINIDETTLQVLREPGRPATSKSYMWVFRRGDPERPVIIYQYHPTRSADVPREFLRGFTGYVQTDGYGGYDFLDHIEGIIHIGCMAHARRKFMDVVKAGGKKRKPGAADKALRFVKALYRIEKVAREKKLSAQERYELRQREAKPVLDEFREWLLTKKDQAPPKSLLGKAVTYALNQWDRLVAYLEDGHLEIDNNLVENCIRPFVVGRKNWLFSGTPEGAEASALLFSLIETAKANGLEPYAYLRYIFDRLPITSSLEDYEALLPWNLTPEKLKCPVVLQCD